MPNETDTRRTVREHYAKVAKSDGKMGCGPGCCGPSTDASQKLGYEADELAAVPEGADMGLGCGTPLAFAALRLGEVVLDLGSGGGLDCFLAARQVGAEGRVIGVDMTAEMVAKGRSGVDRLGTRNVEFRLGEIEHLPVADLSVDVVISNCVINLAGDKARVFREAFRVLRPGGRIAIADIVATSPLPDELREGPDAAAGCIAGATPIPDLRAMLSQAGFRDVTIDVKMESRHFIRDWSPGSGAEEWIASAAIQARRPLG